MSRIPIRLRLTAAFALAFILMLAGAAAFVYTRLEADLNETIDEGLAARAAAVVRSAEQPDRVDADLGAPSEAEDGFVAVVAADGRVVELAGGAEGPVLDAEQLRRASREPVIFERSVAGLVGDARVLAQPASTARRPPVIAVGQTLEDRDETLSELLVSFAIGGAVAIFVASLVGYVLASAGLAPIEAIRRRAAEVSLEPDTALLPLPAARDEVRRLGETLNAMLIRLRASYERERRFVADASHELRTPIAVIRAELEGALRAAESDPSAREPLIAAIEECDRLGQLAEDLLVLAREAGDGIPLSREQVRAVDLLEATRTRFAARAAERGRRLEVDAEAGLRLSVDPLRMRQALGNLVDNALRHGAGNVLLSACRTGSDVQIEVADSGAGFPAQFAPRAFERFARADESRSGSGAGLGLALVRAIAEAHGGSAEIIPGERPGIILRLPISPPASAGTGSQGDLSSGA